MAPKTYLRACAFFLLAIAAGTFLEIAPATAQTSPSVNWVQCGSDANCNFGLEVQTSDIVTVRYGVGATATSPGAFQYFVVSGANGAVPCSSSIFGDPVPGTSETCAYTTSSYILPGRNPPTQSASWGSQIAENAQINLMFFSTGYLQWIRYGANERFSYALVAPQIVTNNTPALTFNGTCSNAQISHGFDPSVGPGKTCQAATVTQPTPLAPTWTSCALEGFTCNLPGGGLYLVAYQTRNSNNPNSSIFAFVEAPSISCTMQGFGTDPLSTVAKQCFYYKLR